MNYADECLKLEQLFQPFGREKGLLEHLRELAEPWADECWIDQYGSLIVHQCGSGLRVMIAAQADVQTIVLTYIHEDGSARFLLTGEGHDHIDQNNIVRFANRLTGIVEYDDDCRGASDWQHMRIRPLDGQLHVADRGILTDPTGGNEREIHDPHCGEVAGCIALLQMMQQRSTPDLDLYYVFAVGSESDKVSQRGVKCATYHIQPDIGISIETVVNPLPRVHVGGGPVVLLRDEHSVLSKAMVDLCRTAATYAKTPLQYAVVAETERETALYHFHCAGADALTLVIPTQPVGACSQRMLVSDLEATIALVKGVLRECHLSSN